MGTGTLIDLEKYIMEHLYDNAFKYVDFVPRITEGIVPEYYHE